MLHVFLHVGKGFVFVFHFDNQQYPLSPLQSKMLQSSPTTSLHCAILILVSLSCSLIFQKCYFLLPCGRNTCPIPMAHYPLVPNLKPQNRLCTYKLLAMSGSLSKEGRRHASPLALVLDCIKNNGFRKSIMPQMKSLSRS